MTTAAPSRAAIRATGLCKSYGDKLVLDEIDVHVAEGTVFALLGPNGACLMLPIDALVRS